MTNSSSPNAKSPTPPAEYQGLLPAMAGIALYMFVLAGVVGYGAATGRFPRIFLILCVLFVAAAVGLIRLYRWGWALTSAASFLLMSYGVWAYIHTRLAAALVMSFLNLIFFLYLVRPEVRERLH
jgi:hypothetical protein